MGSERPLDRIHIRDLGVRCILGVYPHERREKQDVLINVALHADLSKACVGDRIEDTVDYKAVKERILEMVGGSECFLVERLAQRVAEVCLEDPLVARAEVTVDKPGALRYARSVAVQVVRERGDDAGP